MRESITNRLNSIRKARGLSAAELARHAGVSRQTIHAIEAGAYVPNTVVALRLASLLETTVEEIFELPPPDAAKPQQLRAAVLSRAVIHAGTPVRLCEIGERQVAVPVNGAPFCLPEADAIVAKAMRGAWADLSVIAEPPAGVKAVLVAGCDPAIGLLAREVRREASIELIAAAASSRLALEWLKEGKVHIAGSHLRDAATGEFNLPYLRRQFPGEDLVIITFAHWEEGFLTAPGNPLGICEAGDLARPGLRMVNREQGAGSRALLDRLLKGAGLAPARVSGYDCLAQGHLAAAYAVYRGDADCCIATRSAALAFGLGFVPLEQERYDFVLRRESLKLQPVQAVLDTLQRSSLRRRLESQAGYETAHTGDSLV
jgi:putative molybdopterin biosynthesis protein